jgi:hypothetical protein
MCHAAVWMEMLSFGRYVILVKDNPDICMLDTVKKEPHILVECHGVACII